MHFDYIICPQRSGVRGQKNGGFWAAVIRRKLSTLWDRRVRDYGFAVPDNLAASDHHMRAHLNTDATSNDTDLGIVANDRTLSDMGVVAYQNTIPD